ncbi:MAG: hypothetical protein HQK61_08185 [Desulfamplus sp.]|nr:hypothetical protein [Desulfamplus sp.]
MGHLVLQRKDAINGGAVGSHAHASYANDLYIYQRKLQEQIDENLKLRADLENSEKERHALSSKLITAYEIERKRIAFELHDVLGKSLTAIKFSVENTLLTMNKWGNSKSCDQLENVVSIIQETIKETREITKNLWPPVLDDLGILATISWYSREFEKIYPWVFVNLDIDIEESQIADCIKIVIFRIMQEAMTNSIKHSGCCSIRITLEKINHADRISGGYTDHADRIISGKDSQADPVSEESQSGKHYVEPADIKNNGGGIRLEIADNGKGFTPPPHPHASRHENAGNLNEKPPKIAGLGLLSMKERCALSGGFFEIRSACGSGTTIAAFWPENKHAQE